MTKPFLKQRGGYRSLKVYRVTTLIYNLTYHFAHTYLSCGDRTIDQMVQAARSGKQNIAEGSAAGTHSSETEIRLTDVAKASLEELMVDYEDYLRTRELTCGVPVTRAMIGCEPMLAVKESTATARRSLSR